MSCRTIKKAKRYTGLPTKEALLAFARGLGLGEKTQIAGFHVDPTSGTITKARG